MQASRLRRSDFCRLWPVAQTIEGFCIEAHLPKINNYLKNREFCLRLVKLEHPIFDSETQTSNGIEHVQLLMIKFNTLFLASNEQTSNLVQPSYHENAYNYLENWNTMLK